MKKEFADFTIYSPMGGIRMEFYITLNQAILFRNGYLPETFEIRPDKTGATLEYSRNGNGYKSFRDNSDFPDMEMAVRREYCQYKTNQALKSPNILSTGCPAPKIDEPGIYTFEHLNHTNPCGTIKLPTCDCGAKHTSNPNHHSDWCSINK